MICISVRAKESENMKGSSSSSGSSVRNESEKEKTKMRERQRRAITGKIFHGLRKHGGYRLSPRADINEVLRHLAAEAGWTVQSDGTTFRSSSVGNFCPVCGATRQSATPTPTSSVVIAGGGGGECSSAASPRYICGGISASLDPAADGDIPMAFYNDYGGGGGGFSGGLQQYQSSSGGFHGGGQSPAAFRHQLQEARASNQNTPVGSPLRRANYGS